MSNHKIRLTQTDLQSRLLFQIYQNFRYLCSLRNRGRVKQVLMTIVDLLCIPKANSKWGIFQKKHIFTKAEDLKILPGKSFCYQTIFSLFIMTFFPDTRTSLSHCPRFYTHLFLDQPLRQQRELQMSSLYFSNVVFVFFKCRLFSGPLQDSRRRHGGWSQI